MKSAFMEILSIIPARGGSKEIPLKNLVKLNGKPLLDYTFRASQKSKYVTRTIISSDSQKILKHAKNLGSEVHIRPKKFSTDSAQIEPLLLDILKKLKNSEKYTPEVVILLQNTSPLRTSKHIDEAIKLFLKGKYDSVLSGFNSHYFIWEKSGKIIRPKNHKLNKRLNRQDMKTQFCENGAIYISKLSSFQNSKCRVSGKIGLYEMTESSSLQVDSKYDLFLIEQILKTRKYHEK